MQEKIDVAIGEKLQDNEDGIKDLLEHPDTIYTEDDQMLIKSLCFGSGNHERFWQFCSHKGEAVSQHGGCAGLRLGVAGLQQGHWYPADCYLC